MVRKNLFAILFLALAIMTCQSADSSRTVVTSSEADKAAVSEALEQYVEKWNAEDLDGIMALMADDVVALPPGYPAIIGKKALRSDNEQFFSKNTEIWKPTIEYIEVSGDLAFVRAKELLTTTPKDSSETKTLIGKGIYIFRRGEDGSWRCVIDIWNSNKPND